MVAMLFENFQSFFYYLLSIYFLDWHCSNVSKMIEFTKRLFGKSYVKKGKLLHFPFSVVYSVGVLPEFSLKLKLKVNLTVFANGLVPGKAF